MSHVKRACSRLANLNTPAHARGLPLRPVSSYPIVYTNKHCSWLNQVEIWFSVLARRLLRRGDFQSIADLRAQISAFILYFNRTLAHPYRWTYTGRALRAA